MQGSDRWHVLAARLSLADRGHPDAETEYQSPSLDQVLSLFGRLRTTTGGDLFISGAPGARVLMVCGGPSLYLVSCIGDAYGAYNLVDPARTGLDGWLTLTAGRVDSAVEEAATVGQELAEQAIRYFHVHGCINPQLHWQ